MFIRTLFAASCVVAAVGVTAVVAQTDVAAARKDLMKANGKYAYANLNRMVRDQMPYDQAVVDAAFAQFAEAAPKIPGLFPPGSYQGPVATDDYYATQKIFDNPDDVKARSEKLVKAVADTRGKIKDIASLKTLWPPFLKDNCDSCHDGYRVKKG